MLRRLTLAPVLRAVGALGASSSAVRFNSESAESTNAMRALQVAKDANKLKRQHQSANPSDRKKVELEAWQLLNTLSKSEIENCDGHAIALTLNAWSYFAKYWEHGQDGPHGPSDPLNQTVDS